ncbi:hypothetical protein NDU88_005183, partial [Pleurodeles waltl]
VQYMLTAPCPDVLHAHHSSPGCTTCSQLLVKVSYMLTTLHPGAVHAHRYLS